MTLGSMDFKASEAFRGVTVNLTVRMRLDWRFRLGIWLVRLGVRLMGARPVVEEPDGQDR